MAEIRVQIPDDTLKAIQDKISGSLKATDLARDALTMFNWAIEERAKGREILSSDPEGTKMTRLAMPTLTNVKVQGR